MKLTKYEHACFAVEQDGQVLVVDPGAFTTDFVVPNNVVAVVVTHEHPDHLDLEKLAAITDKNPEAVIYAHPEITSQLGEFKAQSVIANEGIKIGNFELEFYGGKHAIIHPDIPAVANLGVLINNKLYYPGDSLTLPEQDVKWLAIPVSAPWMKLSEAIDFVRAVQPSHAFPTHDALLSDIGKSLADRLVPQLTTTDYQRLAQPIDI